MGKTTAILHALLSPNMYRGCFSRIYVFSGSILEDGRLLDKSWQPLLDYCTDELGIDQTREQTFFPADPKALSKVLQEWETLSEHWKDKIIRGVMKNQVRPACVICDDVSDQPSFAKHSSGIMSLAVRARHVFIGLVIYSVQKLRSIQSAVRVNVRNLWLWRARNLLEYKAVLEEVGNFVTPEQFAEMYKLATQGHDFLNIRLDQEANNMFFKAFETRLAIR